LGSGYRLWGAKGKERGTEGEALRRGVCDSGCVHGRRCGGGQRTSQALGMSNKGKGGRKSFKSVRQKKTKYEKKGGKSIGKQEK